MDKKYEFTDETKEIDGRILHRIVATKDFYRGNRISIVMKGDLGGFIESEDNLSHDGGSWVMNNSCVYERAHIVGNALVGGGCAHVHGNSLVSEHAYVYGYANIHGYVNISGNATVSGNAHVHEYANICGNAHIGGNANIHGYVNIPGNATVNGNAHVHEYANICGNAHICENADISSDDGYAVVSGFGSENRTTTFYLSKDNEILVSCGCFNGALKQFRDRVKITHGGTPLGQEYLIIADLMEMRFNRVIESKEEK